MTNWNKLLVSLGVIGMQIGSLNAQETIQEWNHPTPIKKEESALSNRRALELFDFSLDIIRTRIQQTGLEYARVGAPVVTVAPVAGNGSYISPPCDIATGIRLGFGIDACDCWDAHVSWTRLRYNVVASETASTNRAVEAVLVPGSVSVEAATADFTLGFDIIDATVGRKFFIDRCFQMMPFMGIRYLGLREDFNVTYIGGDLASDVTPFLIEQDFSFRGLGGYCGTGIEINVGCGVCLFGECGIALLAGAQEVLIDETAGPNDTPITDITAAFCATKFMANSKIGVCWNCSLCDGRVDISVKAAFEQQYIANVREMPCFARSQDAAALNVANVGIFDTDGDLGTAGFTFGVTLGF